jgi:phi13 family phage major tail protein
LNPSGEFAPLTGLESVYIAGSISDTVSAYSAGTPKEFAPAENFDWAAEQAKQDLYLNNVLADQYYGLKKDVVRIRITDVSQEVDAEIRGIYRDPATGRMYSTGKEEPGLMALGAKINKGHGDYVYIWFPKGRFSGGNIIGTTKKGDVTINIREYVFEALVTAYQFTVNGETRGISWSKGDTSDDAFTETGWFSAVQTPLTSSAPSAVALSTIVPADGDPDIAITAEIVLTFNNKIASESIMVMDAAGNAVTITKSWDSTGKILTLAHVANFSNETVYLVAVAGVVDVYGQTLAAASKDFTTIA